MIKTECKSQRKINVARFVKSHDLAEELLENEMLLIQTAISPRRSHLKSIDALNQKGERVKVRKACPTPKKRKFDSKLQADEVLHFISNRRKEAEAAGQHFRFQQYRSYPCHNHWHHSSKPELASLESLNVVA